MKQFFKKKNKQKNNIKFNYNNFKRKKKKL